MVLLLLLKAVLILSACNGAWGFKEGEYISSSRKSQFPDPDSPGSNIRTQWHDLLGSHCPRFGHNRLVAIPLPSPHASHEGKKFEYKIQMSFDGDRYVTSWLKLLGPGAPSCPFLIITLRKAGEELLGVSAEVTEASTHYLHSHARLVDEFKNASHWPKHLLVHYHWQSEHEADLDRGLFALMALSLTVLMIIMVNAARGSKAKLEHFVREMTLEDPPLPSGSSAIGLGGVAVMSPSSFSRGGGGKGD